MCPGFILQQPKPTIVDSSLQSIDLAQIENINVFSGEIIIYNDVSDMGFSLKVRKLILGHRYSVRNQ